MTQEFIPHLFFTVISVIVILIALGGLYHSRSAVTVIYFVVAVVDAEIRVG